MPLERKDYQKMKTPTKAVIMADLAMLHQLGMLDARADEIFGLMQTNPAVRDERLVGLIAHKGYLSPPVRKILRRRLRTRLA
jgi:hypothetical protein